MQTRTYTELFDLIQSLFGSDFATVEATRIRSLVNSRANKAYLASNYWPRFLTVGEERTVASNVVAYDESGLSSIDKFLIIHKTQPFYSSSAQEFDFYVTGTGATLVAGSLDPTTAFVTYKAVHDSTYGDQSADTTTVPREWFDYIAHGSYADAMRMDGQTEKAAIADAEAMDMLVTELLRVDDQTPAFLKGRISTNSNMQSR
jgi:hypothetical protein